MLQSTRLLLSSILATSLVLFLAWAAERRWGEPFGAWSWNAVAFTFLSAALVLLAIAAVSSGPFEPRLRRWNQATDPLAIGFQMDLRAAELNPPQRVGFDSRWLWVGMPVAAAWIMLGVSLAA